jgi:hypothetical protein
MSRTEREERQEERSGGEASQFQFAYCSLPPAPPPQFPAVTDPDRLRLLEETATKWVNGTVLRYYFFDRDTDGKEVIHPDGTSEWRPWTTDEANKDVVRNAFGHWKEQGIGLDFLEVQDRGEAEVRIGFMQGDGYWSSHLGRDILNQGVNERTMNFGRPLVGNPRGFDVALHEIGHTLGLPHEHQNPIAGIEWDEEKVYAYFAQRPNEWDRRTTFYNILRKLLPDTVQGSSWDVDSVMHYPFDAGLILQPEKYRTQPLQPAGGLSARDLAWIRAFYPLEEQESLPELVPFRSQELAILPVQQRNFVVHPPATRQYTFQTFGVSDTVMVLFEDVNGALRYRAGDDDSGEDRNASFRVKLFKDREYVVRIRLNFSQGGETAVMMS